MRLLMLIFYVILIVLGVSFAALNASSVQVNFYVKTMSLPISVLMILMLGVGMVVGFMLMLNRYLRLKIECNKARNQLRITEREIKNLRAIPLQDQH